MTTLADTLDPAGVSALAELLAGRRVVVLAGAGCSTESGIPDYRGPGPAGRRRQPMTYQEFVGGEAARARYWARSAVGWPRMAAARPNPAHFALSRLEEGGVVRGIITQNVDGLHHAAGSRRVIELHGSLAWVRCLQCGARVERDAFQDRLYETNVAWAEWVRSVAMVGEAESNPDGDVELPSWAVEGFRVPPCGACGGVLKPDVVFFGENVPRERVDEAWRLYEEGEVLLVVGSSLTVWSGRRFVDRAVREGVPVAVVNIGPTRADEFAALKVEARVGRVLPAIADVLSGRAA